MKKILSFLCIMMAVMAAQSQVVTLKFVGADRTAQDYVRLHHVSVYDHDQLWHQVIYYPDTTLALYQNGTTDIVETHGRASLQLFQNTPNPFTGTTDVNLTTVDAGDVTLEIVDGNGKIVGTHRVRPEIGTHQFRVSLNAAGTYVMTARQNGQASSIKMVCNGGGGSNSITHVGTISSDGTITLYLKSGMSDGSYPFRLGDRMEFIGYAVIDETERVSETVTCNQGYNSDHSLKFDVARPAVTTLAATAITATNAIWHGEVTSDNNALVTERGFCWVAGNGNPTLADNHVAVGNGVGTFDVETWCTAYLQLQPHTTYRVRAYAVNAVGVSYGETRAFTTNDTLPVVTTTPPTDVASNAFTCGGNVVAMNSATLAARGVCWNTTGNPTIADSHTTNGTAAGSFTSSVTGLEPATQYYVRAYATNALGTAYGESYTVTTLNDIPIVATAEVSDIAARTAQCGGEVLNEHGAAVTACGVCWNTTGNPTVADSHTTDGNGLGEFTSALNELTPNTQYYVRAYATNSVGTAYGEEMTLYTRCDLPEVTTTQPTDVTTTSFTCGGDVIAINCDDLTARGVCWNTTGNPTVTDSHTTDGTAAGSFTSSVTGLEPATQYYVRAYATNAVGTAYGETYIKTTMNDIPIVVTADVSDIAARTAQCGGEVVNEHGANVTERGICWNTTGNPTIADSYTTDGSTGLGEFVSTLNALTPNTQYYVRAYATNSVGTAYGEVRSFTTLCNLPEVTTTQPTVVTTTSFTCGGNVTAINCDNLIARGVCWNTTGNPTVTDNHTTNGAATGSFTSSVTGLEPATQYYVRAYATNALGTGYGETYTVTTLNDIPIVVTAEVNNIAARTAQCGGEVLNEHGASVTERGVCWSTTINPTIADSHTTDGSGLGEFVSTLNALTPNTQYNVRAYATNSVGTAYGEVRSFTTLCDLPEVTTLQPANVTLSSFSCGGNVVAMNSVTLTARGVCWNTTGNPTVADSHTTNGTAAGSFTSSVTGLEPATQYYVRAYATNALGTGYGEIYTITTLNDIPIVVTAGVSDIAARTAQCGGEVVNEHGATVTERGVCWNTTGNPTIADSYTTDGNGLGEFASTLNVLTPNTQYYVRAYATNNVGTAYGEERTFSTLCDLPEVTTTQPTDVTTTSFTCGGNVIAINCDDLTARGVCWNTTGNPTVDDSHTTDGNTAGGFTSSVTGLECGTTYYVRAYATNSAGTSYGEEYEVTTLAPTIPDVATLSATLYNGVNVIVTSEVISENCEAISSRGICYSTSPNPTISDPLTTHSVGVGTINDTITELNTVTTYYVRAYATNSVGTAYGNEVSFTTTAQDGDPCPGIPTLTDIDGNTYNTVWIGAQCWMKENLRAKKYANGTTISQGSTTSETTAYWYYPNNSSANMSTYGLLYNWPAVMGSSSSSSANPSGVQGICPTGWHVPSDTEWTQLQNYLQNQDTYCCSTNSYSYFITKSLASTWGWNSSNTDCSAGKNPSDNNATGFSALPAGSFGGSYGNFGSCAFLTISGLVSNGDRPCRAKCISSSEGSFTTGYAPKYVAVSVRCVRDVGRPVVTTTSVTNRAATTATCGGNVTDDGGATITARGVCWSTSSNPTVSDNHTTDGSGTGSFTSSITGLTAGTTYYVRAYATNSEGTAYGSEVNFTTTGGSTFTCGTSTLTDVDGNTYNTVQIGTQCWMKENLRTTKYAGNTPIAQGSESSTTTAYWYYPNGDASNKTTYGLLYNWPAVMRDANSSSTNPSGVQGICPTGWHVPSDAEWTQLTDYVSSQSQYVCRSDNTYIAKALAGTTGWNSSTTTTCAVGNTPGNNNATGFSALPAGACAGNYYTSFSFGVAFWSSTEHSARAYQRSLNYSNAGVGRNYDTKDSGYSVRCVKN